MTSHVLPKYQQPIKTEFGISDITICFCVRLHKLNPWILDNIKLQLTHYHPRPKILVIDQGSESSFAESIKNLIDESGDTYIYDDYQELYSPSRAHNMGASNIKTSFIFFTDPDFFAVSDIFQRIISVINNTYHTSQFDLMLNFPAYHLTQEATVEFRGAKTSIARSAILEGARLNSIFGTPLAAEFVVPYSNVYLCRKDAFMLTGGYDECFAGHGSEDFEFLLRYALVMGRYPIPAWATLDIHRPIHESYFYQHNYEGFRALLGAMSFSAETSGMATFHLKHPIDSRSAWRTLGDRSRNLLRTRVQPYCDDRRVLIKRDWLPRPSELLVFVGDEQQTNMWLAFRLIGYRLQILTADNAHTFDFKKANLNKINAFAFFQPDLQRIPAFSTIYREAIHRGLKCFLVEEKHVATSCNHRISKTQAYLWTVSDNATGKSKICTQVEINAGQETYGFYKVIPLPGEHQIGARAYLLSRLGLLPQKQWYFFSKTGRLPKERMALGRLRIAGKAILVAGKTILQSLLPKTIKK